MTFLEQAKKNGHVINDFNLMHTCCPYQLGLEKETCDGNKTNEQCEECWNREMPNTKQNVAGMSVIPQSEIDAWHNAHESGKAEGYEQGLNDAWELAKKVMIRHGDYSGALSYIEMQDIYDTRDFMDIMNLSPQEALAKMKAYEEAQIKVGDVVAWTDFADDTFNGVVLDFKDNTDNEVVVFNENGCVDVWKIADCKKTGKHIDITDLLKQIGE